MFIGGIVSGIDTNAFIDAVISAASIPKQTIEAQNTELGRKKSAVANLATKMSELSTTIEDLTKEGIRGFTTQISSEDEIGVTTGDKPASGTFDITVNRLATGATHQSASTFASTTDGVAMGTYSINYAGQSHDVVIDSTNNTAAGLAQALTDISGVSAFLLDTSGNGSAYSMMVQGEDGSANSFDLSGLPTSFNQIATAQNAEIVVNNVTVSVGSNQFSGIPDLTIDLKKAGGPSTRVSTGADITATKDNIQKFIDDYNEIVTYRSTQSVYNTEINLIGPLATDSTTRRAVDELGLLVATEYTSMSTAYTAFSQIGIETNRDGTLSIDEDALDAALQADTDAVEKLFTDANGPGSAIKAKIDDVFVDETSGALTSRQESIEGSIKDNEERIERMDRSLDAQVERLQKQFTAMELAMARMQNAQGQLAALFTQPAPAPQ